MKIILDSDIYRWLLKLNVIQQIAPVTNLENNKIELDEILSKQFMNGLKICNLIQILATDHNLQIDSIDKVKDSNTPASRLFNWNLVQDSLKKLGTNLDSDVKSLIVAGDSEMINEVFKDIYDNESNRLEKMSQPSSKKSFRLKQNKIKESDGSVNLQQLDINTPLSETNSILEFLLIGLSKNLGLKPKQAAALLSDGSKYLAHILVKGVKSNFDPVRCWLQDIYTNIKRIIQLVEANESNLYIILGPLRPGLLSKDEEIANWTARIYSKISYDLANIEMLPAAYEWFCKENGGLQACLLCIKRHAEMQDSIITLILQISRYNIKDMLTVQLFNNLQGEYLKTIYNFLPFLFDSKLTQEELEGGVLKFFIDQAFILIEKKDTNDQIIALKVMSTIWISNTLYIEETLQLGNSILDLMKKASSRNISQILKIETIIIQFRLLDFFASQKNSFAALIYKKLTFQLIEDHQNIILRDVLLRNFLVIFKKYKNIPIEILIEPYIKQIQIMEGDNNYVFNICDIEFLQESSIHPNLNIKLSIKLFDLLSKIYHNDVIWAKSLFIPIKAIINKFIETDAFQDYIIKLAKVSLAMYFSLCKNIKNKKNVNDADIIDTQKRALIIELIKFIIECQIYNLNQNLKPLIVNVFQQLSSIKQINNKGILALIQLYGNPADIIDKIQQQEDYEKKEKQSEGKKSMVESHKQKLNFLNKDGNNKSRDDDSVNKSNEFSIEKPLSKAIKEPELFFLNQDSNNKSVEQSVNKSNEFFIEKPQKKAKKVPERVDSKVIERIEQIKNKRETDIQKKKQEEEKQQQRQQKLIKKAEEDIVKRNALLGVEIQDPSLQKYIKLIYEEGEIDLQNQFKDDIEPIYCNFEEEEQRDRESINFLLKKYQRGIKFIFQKYAQSSGSMFKGASFNDIQKQYEWISSTDVWKFVRDHEMDQYLKKEEVQTIIKKLNMKMPNKQDIQSLDFDNYQTLLINLAYLCFSKPQRDLRTLGIIKMFDMFFKLIVDATKKKGLSTSCYDEYEYQNMSNQEISQIKQLNEKLQKNPDINVPEQYKKQPEKLIKNIFQIGKNLKIPQSYVIANEILTEILDKQFQISIMEPQIKLEQVYKIKLKAQQKLPPKPEKEEQLKPEKQDQEIQRIQSQQPRKNRNESLPNSHASRMKSGNREINSKSPQLKNKIKLEKEQKQEEDEQQKLQKDKEFKERQKQIKKKLEEISERKREELLQKKEEEAKQLEEQKEKERQKKEKEQKYQQEQKKKLQEFQKQQGEEEKRKKEQEEQEKKLIKDKEKKENQQFMQKQKEKLEQEFKEITNQKETEKDTNKKQKEEEKKKEEIRQQKMKEILQQEKEKKQQEIEFWSQLENFENSSEVVKFYENYDKPFKQIFDNYIEYNEFKLKGVISKDHLQLKGFQQFSLQFNLVPDIISLENLKIIYNNEMKRNQNSENGMTFKQFKHFLTYFGVKGKQYFDKGISQQAQGEEQKEDTQEDPIQNIEDIQNTSIKSLEGLVTFMNFSFDKILLANKLRTLKSESTKVNPQKKKQIDVSTKKL